ncbi:phage shock envelope stress response protein PspM [Actinophytocola xanthii]|uniref:Uncharacterized protein n=1 Tax=Actinophytocola xanthii TaxID=1912961 RepID=A0A1Q8C8T9_9PSEU|nr:hypothetical protein [Actinophytocola xanthii]OLF10771.1 hypothetical protein BU204_31215 [Actinophytocola xanthii]
MALSGRDINQLTRLASRYVNGQVVQQVQDALARRGDEAVRIERQRRKLERRRMWASRWATAWALITAICMVFVVGALTGAIGTDDDPLTAAGGIAVSLVTGTLAIRAARKMTLLKRAQREFDEQHAPAAVRPAPTALPPKGSAAREPMQRLAEAETALAQVLAQLTGANAAVPAESVAQARATGTEAANALRAVAAQLAAVEVARDHAPPLERGPLVEGVTRLREQLDEGLDGYRSLVAAAGRVVAATSAPGPKQELTEATDHLAGLAAALRELSESAS